VGLFGKQRITEIEAAGQFVLAITKGVYDHWPSMARELNELPESGKPISEDQYAAFEFVLAVIAFQIQALPNLLSKEQADRIRNYILQCISTEELGSYPSDTIPEYQTAWDASIEQGESPFYGIASVLFDKLGCESTLEMGEGRFKNPILIMGLAEKVVHFGGPWWKDAVSKYDIVP
jgi:hypothetical protein